MSPSYYSFWLVPQEPDLKYFQDLINTLAKRFNTVPFCPHVTLYSGPFPATVDVRQVCAALPMSTIELEIVNLAYEARFSKTLYVQLQLLPTITQLVNCLIATIPNARPSVLAPHISLLYHRLEVVAQQELAATITLPRPMVRFNQIQAIAAPENFETQEHVASLRCVHRQLMTTL